MARYVLVQSNWTSINSISLDLVCDINIEEENQSEIIDKQHDDEDIRKTSSSEENIKNVTLRSNDINNREDPVIILSVLQPDEYHIISIQFLSNAKHIEFYHQEYIGSCQGSRITELDNESIYESSFEFNQPYKEITLKCLKLADTTELIVYCLQINLNKTKQNTSSASIMNLPFDLNRVRSMIDETNLSTNARQFLNDLQHIQTKRTKESSSQQFNLSQLMLMMKEMKSPSSTNTEKSSIKPMIPILNEMSSLNEQITNTYNKDNDMIKQELNLLENRLQIYINKQFLQLQQHIDDRLNHLEEKLTNLNKNLQ